MDKATEILIAAKKILESELDWCQGKLFDYEEDTFDDETGVTVMVLKSVCAVGAIRVADSRIRGVPAFNCLTEEAVEAITRLQSQLDYPSVGGYNDLPSTSKEDILLMFKRAINA